MNQLTELSPEEKVTLDYYQTNALTRNCGYGNPEFWRPEFEKFRQFCPEGHIVDLGCGAGRDAVLFMSDSRYMYLGVDISPNMIRQAQLLVTKAPFQIMNICHPDLWPNSANGFWAAGSLLHLPKEKLPQALNSIRSFVKIGGIGFIALKEGDGEKFVSDPNGSRFFAFYQQEEFSTILRSHRFEVLCMARGVCGLVPQDKTVWLTYFVKVV
ncbi:MAG: class I SAM-dependent methyltransferase [Patescibacteria group bacterium]